MWFRFLKCELKFTYSSAWSILHLVIASLLNFYLYFYSAKAFVPKEGFLIADYFTYIVIGDLALTLIHTHMIDGPTLFVRLKQFGIFERILMKEKKVLKLLIQVFLASFTLKFLIVQFHVVLLVLLFGLKVGLLNILLLVLLKFFLAFVFIGFYLISISVACKLKRVSNSIYYLMTILSFFSGVYFPIKVFEDEFFKNLLDSSPIYNYVELVRNLFIKEFDFKIFVNLLPNLFLWGITLGIIGILSVHILNKKSEFINEWN